MQTSGVDVKFTVITLSISIGNGILSGISLNFGSNLASKFKSAE